MKKFIQTLRNIWTIEDLRSRILITLGLLAVYRFGSYLVLPGIDAARLNSLTPSASDSGLAGLFDIFAGGAFSRAAIFALGIMPYISASIVIQLLTLAYPPFQKLQREGESGRNKINQYTRWLTIGITAAQAAGFLVNFQSQYGEAITMRGADGNMSFGFIIMSVLLLTAGTMFVMWLGEKITDRGIGNGISLIIMIGIVARLPVGFGAEIESRMASNGTGPIPILLEIAALLAVIAAVILLVQGTRKIPIQVAKRVVGNRQYGGVRQYLPLKVNAAGVMPIIFAQAIMFLPSTLANFNPESSVSVGIIQAFSDYTSVWYNLTLAALIILFTYFYTALSVNPGQMADDLKKNNAFIPGVKPGRPTQDFIDTVISRITLPGSFFLALVAIMPALASLLGVNREFASFYGGTSMLILVGVVLDTLQQVESHLLMRKYDGLMEGGARIKGRAVAGSITTQTV